MEWIFQVKKEHHRVWKTIGTELGIEVDALSTIEKDHTNDKDRLYAMIDSANPAPTYEAMVKIFQSAHITNTIAGIIT